MKLTSTVLDSAVALLCALLVGLLGTFGEEPSKQAVSQSLGPAVNLTYIDRTVRPGDDFFQFACGEWIRRTKIPADRDYVAIGSVLLDETDRQIAGLIAEAVKSGSAGGDRSRKIANLYTSYMDESGIERQGLAPLRPHLLAIARIRDKRELARALGRSLRADVDGLNNTYLHTANLFGLWVSPGFNDPAHYAAYLTQGGLQLPDRAYYLSTSAEMVELRKKYQEHVTTMLKLAGFSDTGARAARLIELEHAIAEKHVSLTDSNDILKANNTWLISEFSHHAPGLEWAEYFRGAKLNGQSSFIIWQPTAFTGESALVASTALETWKDWLAFHLIEAYVATLPREFGEEDFAFFGKALLGTPEERPRWERGVDVVNRYLGDSVGQMYAERYFSLEAKAQIESMVTNLMSVFRRRIDALPWMDRVTKVEAQAKLDALYIAVGYPEVWRDYSSYEVKADDSFGNFWRGDLFEYERSIGRIGLTVDRKEWARGIYPQTVDSLEYPLQNALSFPAALFQPPYFDIKAPAAANYASVGQSIGHEITHIFDSQGSVFDSTGRVRNWWKPADLEHFNQATARLAKQYDSYKPFPDLAVNGQQTLAENIADLAGLAAAYDAYKASLTGESAPAQGGASYDMSDDQEFFLAYAQSWAEKDREASRREFVLTHTHAPNEYRADTVRNLDAWYAAFDIKPEEKLYLALPDRVHIW